MPQGFFTVEQWERGRWTPVFHLSCRNLSEAIKVLEDRGNAGFFRVVQTQRMIWAEKVGSKLKLRKWHANSPETLQKSAEAFVRDGGKWPTA